MDSSSSKQRVKMVGAVVAAAFLLVAGVAALNNAGTPQMVQLDHAEAIVRAENMNLPTAQLPEESTVNTPRGWVIDSDKPVEGAEEEDASDFNDSEEDLVSDDDIDSPFMFEEDENGQKFVAELDDDVIMDDGEEENTEEDDAGLVSGDAKKKLKCKKNLRKCNTKKKCKRVCGNKCKPVIGRICRNKKYCRCFCKYKGNKKAAVKCVAYRRKVCRKGRKYLCTRRCNKFCKRVPHCYCCPKRHILKKCRRLCKRMLVLTKCGRCRCRKLKCMRSCRLMCKK